MTWPYDANSTTFIGDKVVPSAHLNEIQTQIQNIAGGKNTGGIISAGLLHAIPEDTNWVHDAVGALEKGWIAGAAASSLFFTIPGRVGAVLSSLEIKIFNADALAKTWSLGVYEIDTKFSSAGVAPTQTALAAVSPSVPAGWDEITLDTSVAPNLLPRTYSADMRYVLRVLNDGSTAGDRVAGVLAHYTQLY